MSYNFLASDDVWSSMFHGREVQSMPGSLEPKIGRALLVFQQSLLFAWECFPLVNVLKRDF